MRKYLNINIKALLKVGLNELLLIQPYKGIEVRVYLTLLMKTILKMLQLFCVSRFCHSGIASCQFHVECVIRIVISYICVGSQCLVFLCHNRLVRYECIYLDMSQFISCADLGLHKAVTLILSPCRAFCYNFPSVPRFVELFFVI